MLFLSTFAAVALLAQNNAVPQVPGDVAVRTANIISEGTRMQAEVYSPKGTDKPLPCILMAHGWGGTAAGLRRDAIFFAKHGYFAVAFDYRGWGSSDARLILTKPAPPAAERPNGKFTAEVQEVRGVVDPIDQGIDWLNAIHWIAAEPGCDMQRFGIWGSSFSGGLVVWVAARDHRVKVLHSQVGSLTGADMTRRTPELRKQMEAEATAYARGAKQYPEAYKKEVGNLIGAPIRAKFDIYSPVDEVNRAKQCAMQFVIAENEELFDNRNHAILAYDRFEGVKRLVNVPKIKHYGIYYEARDEAQRLALEWFEKHLKPQSSKP